MPGTSERDDECHPTVLGPSRPGGLTKCRRPLSGCCLSTRDSVNQRRHYEQATDGQHTTTTDVPTQSDPASRMGPWLADT